MSCVLIRFSSWAFSMARPNALRRALAFCAQAPHDGLTHSLRAFAGRVASELLSAKLLGINCPLMCRFSDAGNDGAIDALGRPASEKRQGRKSRSVVQRRCGVRYGDLAAGLGLKRSNRSGCGGWFGADRG
jgi:hypothetical protein